MTIVLFNKTPIVQKLVDRLAQKRGDVLAITAPEEGEQCDVLIVDDSMDTQIDAAQARVIGRFTLYLGSRFEAMPSGFDATLPKPFLPNELSTLLDDAKQIIGTASGAAAGFDLIDESWGMETEEAPLFNAEEIDEVKKLLVDVEDEDADATVDATHAAAVPEASEAASLLMDDLDEVRKDESESDAPEWEDSEDAIFADMHPPEAEEVSMPELEQDADPEIDVHARGLEALQDLMAILSDEAVAKALKEMGVRIDISFGEKA